MCSEESQSRTERGGAKQTFHRNYIVPNALYVHIKKENLGVFYCI